MELLSITAQAQQDYTTIITGVAQLLISSGVVFWVYKVLTHQSKLQTEYYEKRFNDFEKQIEKLEKKTKDLEVSESKWFKYFWKLYNIVQLGANCSNAKECLVKKSFDEFNKKEDILV